MLPNNSHTSILECCQDKCSNPQNQKEQSIKIYLIHFLLICLVYGNYEKGVEEPGKENTEDWENNSVGK